MCARDTETVPSEPFLVATSLRVCHHPRARVFLIPFDQKSRKGYEEERGSRSCRASFGGRCSSSAGEAQEAGVAAESGMGACPARAVIAGSDVEQRQQQQTEGQRQGQGDTGQGSISSSEGQREGAQPEPRQGQWEQAGLDRDWVRGVASCGSDDRDPLVGLGGGLGR